VQSLGAFWAIVAPFIAVAIIGVTAWAAVILTNAIRRYDYGLFEDKSAPILAEQFPLPEAAASVAEARRKSASALIGKVHQEALAPPRPLITTRLFARPPASWSPLSRSHSPRLRFALAKTRGLRNYF
jgi:hypothetical protein